jgi:hypothetical protein
VSAQRTKLSAGLGELLLALYPEAWRERYGAEVSALMEDDPPRMRGLASLLRGAADAHVRPQRSWGERVPASASMRLSVGALFACWMLVALAGSVFAKETEGLSPVEHGHGLMIAARDMITIGAFVGASAIALGGLPLVWQALGAAVRRRDRRLAGLLAAPALAAGLLLAFAALLLLVAPSRHGGFPASFVLGVLVPLTLAVLACAAIGALAPKAVMRRAQPPARLLRLAAWAGQALTGAILLVTLGLLLYVPALWSVAEAGAAPAGPFGASTRLTLCFALAGAVLASGPALVASARARRAALQKP